MSTRKDRFSNKDRDYMKLAINLASNQKGLTGNNPAVGCVIVKNNKIVSYGVTGINGTPHAETIALKKNKSQNKGSTVYITLEPCSHYGKTPPCTKALINSKVKKVIYSIEDSDKRSFSKAKKILNEKKILTKSNLLNKEAKNLYKNYIYSKNHSLPYITGKIASSKNYHILKNNFHITNKHSRKVSHLLRYRNQAILTTYKTINSDNSKLTCRINGLNEYSPIRLIIDKNLRINEKTYIFNNAKKPKTIIFHNSKNNFKIRKLKNKGFRLINMNLEKNNYFDLNKLFKKIYQLGIYSVLVESGKMLIYNMIAKNLFNEFYFFKSNKSINSKNKINILTIRNRLNKKFKKKYFVNTYLDKDNLIHYS